MFNSKIVPSGWWMGLRRIEKGRRPQWDVVLHRPQTLVPSSGSTTSVGPDGPSAARTWCFTARKPLFLRPEAPRLPGPRRRWRARRGASLPASPYSFVRRHHVCRAGWASGGGGVVLHRPQALIPSSGGTTSVSPDGMRWETARPFPFLSTHKERNSAGRKARCCSFIIHIFGSSLFPRGLPFV